MYQKDETQYPSSSAFTKHVAHSAATSSWETDWWPGERTKAPEKSRRPKVTIHNYHSTADDSRIPPFGICNPHLSKFPCTMGNLPSRTPADTYLHKFLLKFFAEKSRSAIQIMCLWGSLGAYTLQCVQHALCVGRVSKCNLFCCSYFSRYNTQHPCWPCCWQTMIKPVDLQSSKSQMLERAALYPVAERQ